MKIKIENKNYTLDTARAIELGVLNPVGQLHKIGTRYKNGHNGKAEYILALVAYETVALIKLDDGNRWSDAVKVEIDGYSISDDDFKRVTANSTGFVKI